jgi:outer membrane protein assembly factor BamB
MIRRRPISLFVSLAAVLASLALVGPAIAQVAGPTLIPESLARRHGLTRVWAAQLQLDPGRGRLTDLTIHEGLVVASMEQGFIQAIDAETGRTLWKTKIGRRELVNGPVGSSPKYIAACNGSTLYILDRKDGRELMARKLEGAPGAAPVMTDERVYVPTINGAIESYKLDFKNPHLRATTYRSESVIEEAPLLAGKNVIWATHKGWVYSAAEETLKANFKFRTRGMITAGLSYRPPLIFAASADGYVYAIDEKDGRRRWQFSTGFPVRNTPVAIGDSIYAIPELNGMFCLAAENGAERWFSRDVAQFVAASATRLYTADEAGQMQILDARSGAHIDMLPTQTLPIKVHNVQTDRIYLATTKGMLQCLREIQQVRPLNHIFAPAVAPPEAKPGKAAEPTEGAEPAMEEDAPEKPAEGEDDPFATPK